MSFDIYGNPLRRGYCEVHPQVHEEYPCSLCVVEGQQRTAQPELDYQDMHIGALESRIEALEAAVRMLTGPALLGALSHEQMIEDFGNLGVDNYRRALAALQEPSHD